MGKKIFISYPVGIHACILWLIYNLQVELAEKFAEEHYLDYASLSSLQATLDSFDRQRLRPYPKPEQNLFADFLIRRLDLDVS
jgi:hypothetical protein